MAGTGKQRVEAQAGIKKDNYFIPLIKQETPLIQG
jgi:hypothetical protein